MPQPLLGAKDCSVKRGSRSRSMYFVILNPILEAKNCSDGSEIDELNRPSPHTFFTEAINRCVSAQNFFSVNTSLGLKIAVKENARWLVNASLSISHPGCCVYNRVR
ncbi:unnamed protein product [Periconia digitata]|uniref:Uncharacterized protein n=1 Tax=Periconia digitata TaxID=1303443 RepID=A0A9W4U1E9_9PLEO|nr:unnamed protein product [Periconia digitata]